MTDPNGTGGAPASKDTRKAGLQIAARQALEEAEARRAEAQADADAALPDDERGGPRNIEPTRYGDWERKGIAYDF